MDNSNSMVTSSVGTLQLLLVPSRPHLSVPIHAQACTPLSRLEIRGSASVTASDLEKIIRDFE